MRLIPVFLLIAAATTFAADEARPMGEMKTRWAAKVNVDAPLPEYPRPSLVRKNWTNLNGRWDYAIVARDAAQPDKWDGKIVVPFCVESQLSGVQRFVGAEKKLWYKRSFDRPATKAGERVLLHFGAVDWDATVWLNGKGLGKHRGGYDPFSFDVTDALKDGENELVVSVWDPTDAGPQPRGKQVGNPQGIWYTAVTGIWQTVWLEVVPEMYLTRVRASGNPESGELTVELEAGGPGSDGGAGAGIEARVKVLQGDDVLVRGKVKTPFEPLKLKVPGAKAWSPESPVLYRVVVQLGEDEVESYGAMRTVSWKADKHGINRLFLNGEPVFHYGPLDQGWWPDGLYTAPTDDALRYDIEMTKAMGFNMARKHVKVEPARWYYWADKLGLLVWQDMPSGFATGKVPKEKKADHGNFRRELGKVMDAFRFHPSIVAWIPYNEGWGQPDAEGTNATLQWTKKRDPSRFIGAPSGWTDHGWGDWKDMHKYPGPGMLPPMDDRVSVLGEFGGLGLPVEGHLWWDKKNWGYRTYKTKDELHSNYATLMAKLEGLVPRGLAAAVYTQTTDCEGEVNGLMTYDRELKFDLAWMRERHAPLYLPAGMIKTTPIAPTAETGKVEWAYSEEKPASAREFFAFDNGLTDIKSLDDQAALLAELGYAGIGGRPGKTVEMLAALDKHGLKMFATYVTLTADLEKCPIPDNVVSEIEALKGRETIVWLNVGGKSSDEVVVPAIQKLCDLCAGLKLKVVIYPHVNCYTDTVATALRLVKAAGRGNLGVSFNLCHFLKQNDPADLEKTIKAAAPHLWLVSINGCDSGDTRSMNWDRLIRPLGEGSFRVPKVMKLLDDVEYEGPVGLQCYSIKQPAKNHLAKSMGAWKKMQENE